MSSPLGPRDRARRMPAAQRREQLVAVTVDLLREHGPDVTTRQIAEAAGIAEGTIFRAVESKAELIDLAILRAFELDDVLRDLHGLAAKVRGATGELDLEDLLLEIVALLQDSWRVNLELFQRLTERGLPAPLAEGDLDPRTRVLAAVTSLVEPHADALAVDPATFARWLRMVALAGTHPYLSHGNPVAPSEVVRTVLHGLGRR